MSEHQYCEFQAIDRLLTDVEQDALRRYSGRAMITATRFVNSYSYGNFRGSPGRKSVFPSGIAAANESAFI